ncbi:type II toxin-antitoxin system HicA family toxin [Kribbella sp. NPDC050470]|uniref:type II toxin-antitoxin system HicA family toxin n=1 Tax=unclassified Kribbella TaxID=2644121 RepID=UPI0037B2A5D2
MGSEPSLTGSEVVALLQKNHYFRVARVKGSHHIMVHKDGRATTVAVHAGRDVPKGTMGSILRDVGLESVNDLKKKAPRPAADLDKSADAARSGVADARGAPGAKGTRGRAGGRRRSGSAARENKGRTPR